MRLEVSLATVRRVDGGSSRNGSECRATPMPASEAAAAARYPHAYCRRRHSYRSAATGSSFAARAAGSIPNSTPVIALAPSAATIASGGTLAAIGVSASMSSATPAPRTSPIDRADAGERHRLDEELPEDRAARRAERLAHADLARALGDRDHHDRDHAHAADDQADRRQHDHHEEEHAEDLVVDARTAGPA